ncbi:sodium:solute symporter family transporter [Cardinium endosymbiont of Tipula unca]|uniref:sodium:solute symporter family transporter n=1 Tax=Cardinium endosymbiont of Tipula unca TaxID=3066216 RepID=UPI0030D28521
MAFLMFTLAVGLYFSRKKTTFREYAVGNKKFATATLVATVLATAYGGGGLIRTVEQIHNCGLYWVFFAISTVFSIWIISPLADRMTPFMRHLSMAETIGNIYGKIPRVITALSSIASSIAIIAMQINVISLAINICESSLNHRLITTIATLILIFYSTFGGIRAITYTDVLQFVTFTVIIPILAWLMFQRIDKPVADIIPFLQTKEKFQLSSVFSWNINLVSIVALYLSSLVSYIDPPMMQRAYMASSSTQAKRVFRYAAILCFFLDIFIALVGITVFVSNPDLPIQDVWGYIMSNTPSFFKGLICISLVAMTMSTADSSLSACSVMIRHDVIEVFYDNQSDPSPNKLLLTRLTSIIIGLLAMMMAFYSQDLLDLLKISFNFSIPVITAPFILATFGFRGTTKTALIGMATGAYTIIVWNKLIEPEADIDGSFFCMLANGVAMMIAHYWNKQPKGTGWVGENDEVKQRRQAQKRERAQNREKIKALFTTDQLANLTPDKRKLTYTGAYILYTSFISLILVKNYWFNYWNVLQVLIASSFIGLAFIRTVNTPSWKYGLHWLIGLFFCLGLNTFFHWWNVVDLNFTFFLSLSFLAITLFLLPPVLGISIATFTILISLYPIYRIGTTWFSTLSTTTLLLYIIQTILICAIIIYHKVQISVEKKKNIYLKSQKKKQEEEELKEIAYTFNVTQKPAKDVSEEDGTILENVVRNVTESISFLDNKKALYKEDFQSIVNKFADWAAFLKRRSRSKDHLLLMPTETTIAGLISGVEVAIKSELGKVPKIFVDNERRLTIPMVCDVNKMVDLLATAVLKIVNKDTIETDMVTMRFNSSMLAYHRCEDVKDKHPRWQPFAAVGITISNYNTPEAELPIVQPCYNDKNPLKILEHSKSDDPAPIDLTTRKMDRIIRAHYGHMELPKPGKDSIIIVIPRDVNQIREEMIARLPIDLLASESPITPKEQADSLTTLMEFHEYVCKISHVEFSVISEILLLLRRCYGFKRHASGQLFYVRATGIAKILAKWVFHSPKPIYASLLYDLVRYTQLSLSYIKANYNFGIFCFVQRVISVDKHQDIEKSILYVDNRFQDLITEEQLSILYIKLAERLYDLRNAAEYTNKEEVKSMAKEALSIDIELAKKYLKDEPEIVHALENTAKDALEICKKKKDN